MSTEEMKHAMGPGMGPLPRGMHDPRSRSAAPVSGKGGNLLGHVLRFAQLLRVMGIDVSTSQVLDLMNALEFVPITGRADFYYSSRAMLVTRREEFLVFDQAFDLFWRTQSPESDGKPPSEGAQLKRIRLPSIKIAKQEAEQEGSDPGGPDPDGEEGEEDHERPSRETYSPQEILRQKDFAEMSWEEIQEAKEVMANLKWTLAERRVRRYRPNFRGRPDMRRVVRDNLRHGGEPVSLAFRRRITRPRPLVVLCDISGSMERYSRMLLHFLHALTHGLRDTNVEAFVFGTRLTRITHHLRHKDVDESLDEVGEVVPDWSGGTRIGEALKDFNFDWARRVLGRGAVVLVISDGWDRGELELLSKETGRLQRSSYRLMWLSPLLGSNNYEPVQRGIAAIKPCVDDFISVRNLKSLEHLAELLSSVATLRPVRKQCVRVMPLADDSAGNGSGRVGEQQPEESEVPQSFTGEAGLKWGEGLNQHLKSRFKARM